ncbi:hypothetical protein LVJ94_45990 [Pendulispora rubella]|uniref:Uncharacterized protein n=1 Tax=Pendulispora rubella TaxID=2741070 RepID=A0ABZ2L2N5_9BACT
MAAVGIDLGCSDDDPAAVHDAGLTDRILQPPPEVDAGDAAVVSELPCDPSKPFGELQYVYGRPGSDVFGGRLTADEKTVYVATSPVATPYDLAYVTRADRNVPFSGEPTYLTELNTVYNEQWPWVNAKGTTLYYTANRDGGPLDNWGLFRAHRIDGGAFGDLERMSDAFKIPGNCGGPFILGGSELWFPVDGEIYRNLLEDGYVAAKVKGINDPTSVDDDPLPSADGKLVFFASNRPTNGARGEVDVWVARRNAEGDGVETPTNVRELNSEHSDWPTWLSEDGCRIYVTSDRTGERVLYMAARP